MQNKPLLIIAILLTFNLSAQYDGKGPNASRFRPGVGWFYTGLRPAEAEKPRKYDRLIFDITYNDWTGDLAPFNVLPTSIGFGVNVMFDKPLTKGNTVSFGYGLAYHRTKLAYQGSFSWASSGDSTTFMDNSSLSQQKRSFVYNAFSIPLEIRFRKESWKHTKFHIGGRVGYGFGTYQKTKFTQVNGTTISKTYRVADFNALQYGAHIRLGIRNWALFGQYDFNPLFKSSKSVKLNVLKLGLSISLF